MLTSAHGLPVRGRRNAAAAIVGEDSQFAPPDGFGLADALLEKAGEAPQPGQKDLRVLRDLSAIYRPQPLALNELSLSAMGGSLDLDTAFEPPAGVLLKDGDGAFDALSIERWRQRTVIGRDVSVEVVYKGYLFPLGHRCSFVKLTERLFMRGYDGAPVAMLAQRMFLRVGAPRKDFRAYGQPNGGRRFPPEKVEILTRRTPDIVDPTEGAGSNRVSLCGKINLTWKDNQGRDRQGTGLCFWPRVAARHGAEVRFEMRLDAEGATTRLPLIFVDNTAANDRQTVAELVKYYNSISLKQAELNKPPAQNEDAAIDGGPTRRLIRLGQPVRMAPDLKPDDTTYVCAWWDLKAEGRQSVEPVDGPDHEPKLKTRQLSNQDHQLDSLMAGLDQPPFYPYVAATKIRLGQLERLTGGGERWAVAAYEGTYVEKGFPTQADGRDPEDGVFLRLMDAYLGEKAQPVVIDLDGRGERAGAVGQPNQVLVGLSRTRGLVGFDRQPKETDPGDPAKGGSSDTLVSLPRPVYPAVPQKTVSLLAPRLTSLAASTRASAALDAGDLADITGSTGSVDSLAEIFPPNAKLLGLVPLRLVIKIIGSYLAAQPRLREAVDYGAGALANAGTAARGLLTDAVLTPAKDVVARVRAEWERLQSRLAQNTQNRVDIGRAFPISAGTSPRWRRLSMPRWAHLQTLPFSRCSRRSTRQADGLAAPSTASHRIRWRSLSTRRGSARSGR